MEKKNIETAIPIPMDRGFPVAAFAEVAKAIKASGAVDIFHIPDQLQGWWPLGMWNPKNSPIAALLPDPDAAADPMAIGAYAAASAPGMGLTISTDAIRRGPAEMMQAMLTLDNMSDGRAILQIGAGEIKNTAPFGWKRNEGLRRYEDHLRYYDAFWKSNGGPVTMEGNFWSYKDAWMGDARGRRPRIWALGGGPKLIELAIKYADGFATMVPNVISTPERYATMVRDVRSRLEACDRDPDAFDFCPWVFTMIHEDPEVIRRSFDNPLVKWLIAIFGRFNNADWHQYGMEGAFPDDWHYASKLLPSWTTDQADVNNILSRVTWQMFEKTFFYGTPGEVAAQIQPYIEAGANVIDLVDLLAIVLDPQDAQAHLGRQIDVCARIKASNR